VVSTLAAKAATAIIPIAFANSSNFRLPLLIVIVPLIKGHLLRKVVKNIRSDWRVCAKRRLPALPLFVDLA
jgi:hypothetical protein